jgi:hypothetical protein
MIRVWHRLSPLTVSTTEAAAAHSKWLLNMKPSTLTPLPVHHDKSYHSAAPSAIYGTWFDFVAKMKCLVREHSVKSPSLSSSCWNSQSLI